ncbi:MAG: hypothetical protein IKT61_03345 [Clostridia bacterium]|nr:hypothetical protein [Clostridia bacterium]
MSNSNKEGFKLIHKPKKGKMGGLLIVFLWIALWNVIYQLVHGIWHDWDIQIVNWAFFASVTLFFMQEELSYKNRFWYTLVGGSVGLLLAVGVIFSSKYLTGFGLDHTVAVCIPLLVCVAILILANPYLPMIFNNVGFIYFIVSFIQTDKAIPNLPSHLVSLLVGSVVLNLGCTVLLNIYKKNLAKKMSK